MVMRTGTVREGGCYHFRPLFHTFFFQFSLFPLSVGGGEKGEFVKMGGSSEVMRVRKKKV